MKYGALPLTRLIEQFASLPGIGRKTAQRLAFYILTLTKEQAQEFAGAILDAREKIKFSNTVPSAGTTRIRSSARSAGILSGISPPSVWWRTPRMWRPLSAPGNTVGCIMCWGG